MGVRAATARAWRVLRGDTVVITAGRDKGLKGTVRSVNRKRNRVTVEGRNLVKKTVKKTAESPGGIISKEAPLPYSNVMLADPVTGGPVRSAYRFLEDGAKVRVTVGKGASGAVVPRPEILRERQKLLPTIGGPKDTPPDVVQKHTFQGFAAGGLDSEA